MQSAQEINKASERAKKNVEHILTITKQYDNHVSVCDLGKTIDHSLVLLKDFLPSDATIEWAAPENTYEIQGRPTQILQLVNNLYMIAVQMLKRGGVLRLELTIAELNGELSRFGNKVEPGTLCAFNDVKFVRRDGGRSPERTFESVACGP